MEHALELLKQRQESDVLKRPIKALGEMFVEKMEPCGQIEATQTVELVSSTIKEEKKKLIKEILLVAAGNVESLNYRFTTEPVARNVIELHLFRLKCKFGDCFDIFCHDHGAFRALNPKCHKDSEMGNMPMPYIEELDPTNFLRPSALKWVI